MCIDAVDLTVEGNVIEGLIGLGGFAIFGTRVVASHISGNRIGGV